MPRLKADLRALLIHSPHHRHRLIHPNVVSVVVERQDGGSGCHLHGEVVLGEVVRVVERDALNIGVWLWPRPVLIAEFPPVVHE